MHSVIELINLLYWVPVPTKGSKGYASVVERAHLKHWHRYPDSVVSAMLQFDEEGEVVGPLSPSKAWKMSKHTRDPEFDRVWETMDAESRRAYGTTLMSGHGTSPSLQFDL